MKIRKLLLFTSLSVLLHGHAQAIDLTGVINSHDPATIQKDGDTYWHFTTGNGIWSSVSTDLINWSPSNQLVFPNNNYPSWINDAVPGFEGHFWAPDVIQMNGYYYLYYSCSTFGSSRSAIGVVRTQSLNDPDWQDMGMVVSSSNNSDINAIDPGLFRDTDGSIYMTYGSWFGGIGLVEIDSVSGKTLNDEITHLFGGDHQAIEAPYIIRNEDYYYLIVNRGKCCEGVNSTYKIVTLRSENIKGPYENERTILSSQGKYIGPGHFGLLDLPCDDYVSIHYYDGNDNGAAKLDILKMTWDTGYPFLSRDYSMGECVVTNAQPVYTDDNQINIYPNPSENGLFTVDLQHLAIQQTVQLKIYQMNGALVSSKAYRHTNVISHTHHLEKGMYKLEIITDDKIMTKNILVR